MFSATETFHCEVWTLYCYCIEIMTCRQKQNKVNLRPQSNLQKNYLYFCTYGRKFESLLDRKFSIFSNLIDLETLDRDSPV